MSSENRIQVQWEQIPSGDRPVAVEITFTAPTLPRDEGPQRPLNIGLSIDRSGSMAGEKLESARRAATGVIEALREHERLTVTAFDDTVLDLVPTSSLTPEARERATRCVEALEPGGSTALFDGWRRTTQLVGAAYDTRGDAWTIVLSDGMGNHGLVDPLSMRLHAAAAAARGIRTTTVGIGTDYEASQLTALATGGSGEFHHATRPSEIVEIVLGELRSLRRIAVRNFAMSVSPFVDADEGTSMLDIGPPPTPRRWYLLGGEATPNDGGWSTRFDRVLSGAASRMVVLIWPANRQVGVNLRASWSEGDVARSLERRTSTVEAIGSRNVALASRAAHLWRAKIVAHALDLNEAGRFEEAARWVRRSLRDFTRYAHDLPGFAEMYGTLSHLQQRVGNYWRSTGHREAYVMAAKMMRGVVDERREAPASFDAAFSLDRELPRP